MGRANLKVPALFPLHDWKRRIWCRSCCSGPDLNATDVEHIDTLKCALRRVDDFWHGVTRKWSPVSSQFNPVTYALICTSRTRDWDESRSEEACVRKYGCSIWHKRKQQDICFYFTASTTTTVRKILNGQLLKTIHEWGRCRSKRRFDCGWVVRWHTFGVWNTKWI